MISTMHNHVVDGDEDQIFPEGEGDDWDVLDLKPVDNFASVLYSGGDDEDGTVFFANNTQMEFQNIEQVIGGTVIFEDPTDTGISKPIGEIETPINTPIDGWTGGGPGEFDDPDYVQNDPNDGHNQPNGASDWQTFFEKIMPQKNPDFETPLEDPEQELEWINWG